MLVIQFIRFNKYVRIAGFLSAVLLFILSSLTILPLVRHENYTEAVDNSNPSITMNFTNASASVDLSVTSSDGTFASSSNENKASFSVSTTSAGGYTLSVSAADDSGELINGNNSLDSISSAISASTFDNASYNGQWGWSPSKLNSTANTDYLPAPSTALTVLDVTNSSNSTANDYTIAIGARADYEEAIGTYSNTFIVTGVANMAGPACDSSKLCVVYDGNGLLIDNAMSNNVNYDSTTTQSTITKYSHTPNLTDAGERDTSYNGGNGAGNYANSYAKNEVITIPGASTMHVKLTYGGESASWDWVSFWAGNYPDYTAASNYSTGIQNCSGGTVTNGKYGGTTATTVECDVSGDTVTFAFKSDGGGYGSGYGYYAVVTGTSTAITRSVASGAYVAPTGANALFYGWSRTQVASGEGTSSDVEYITHDNVVNNMPGNNGDTKTLYAVWQQGQTITFSKDSNVSSIAVLDSNNNTVGTITSTGQNLTLYQGNTYTFNVSYNTHYTSNVFEKKSGSGTFVKSSGHKGTFTVGNGPAIIDVTSKEMTSIQSFDCSFLTNVGDTEEVYDTRDNEAYLIGKLADNKCWMLDNLRLDLSDPTVLTNITADNTNASATALNHLKNGDGTTSDQYPTAKINNEAWTSSSQNYYSVPMIESNYKDNVLSSTYGDGSGKIGVYYNFCAASAGTYCWGNGTSYDGTPSSDPKPDAAYDIDGDICPAGWRIPTGGLAPTGASIGCEYQSSANAITGCEYRLLANAITGGAPTSGAAGSLTGDDAIAVKTALSIPLSGYILDGHRESVASYSNLLSSTYNGSSSMDAIRVSLSSVEPRFPIPRYDGYSVRCVLMPSVTYTLNYDQNTTDVVLGMPSSQSATVHDDRSHSFTFSVNTIPSRSGYTFAGWGISSDQAIPTYKYENGSFTLSEVSVSMSNTSVTLYAIWQAPRQITFTVDGNVTSIQILDPNGNAVSTITSSGTSVALMEPLTYTVKPTYAAGYGTNTIAKITGLGTMGNYAYSIGGARFTVGAGPAIIDVASKVLVPMQNFDCSSLTNVGDTEEAYDTRDNEVYLVGKLVDGNCWMLDSLRLDLSNSTVLANATASNTNASTTALNYLKNGGGTTLDQWPTAKINNVAWASSSQNYYSIPMAISTYKDITTMSYGSGSGKIGVYYNYCAASAGTYCWGNGTSFDGAPSSDPKPDAGYDIDGDICPAGWRMPTGGAITTGALAGGEYQSLANAITGGTSTSFGGDNAIVFKTALSTPLSGGFYNGSAYNQGSYGYSWSSTWRSSDYMYLLEVSSSNVSQSAGYKYHGRSVRCILMPTVTYTSSYDQNTTDAVSNMPFSQSASIQSDISWYFTLSTSAIPSRSGYIFAGWGTSSDQVIPTYKYENGSFIPSEAIVSSSDNPETLYAIWRAPQQITFTMDSNVSSIQIIDPDGNIVSTITSSGASVTLMEPVTYTIKPTHATGYATNSITETSGSGSLNGAEFTVGSSSATINVTSKALPSMQNFSCSSLADIGDTTEVYDTRDNEVYIIGKLGDGKCWMLDNLRLDLTNSTVLAKLTTSNTNADDNSLTSLRSGNRGAGNQYASSGFATWNSSNASNVYNQAKANADYKDAVASVTYGNGSGKTGVYYNYCAVSAGSYCYDEDTGTGKASYDICPSGWRMPTGGSSGEYQALYATYSSASEGQVTAFRNALSTPLSGTFYNGFAGSRGTSGYFWSSTRGNGTYMYRLYVYSSNVRPNDYNSRDRGHSVRCLIGS